jgi:hypothetical protein
MNGMIVGLLNVFAGLFSFLSGKRKLTPKTQTDVKYIHIEPPERKRSHGVHNNRKRTRSRIIQVIHLQNGKTKFIRHAA